jgi:hypothetical protein
LTLMLGSACSMCQWIATPYIDNLNNGIALLFETLDFFFGNSNVQAIQLICTKRWQLQRTKSVYVHVCSMSR